MAKIVFTELEQDAMARNHVLGDMDIDPAEDPYIAISVLLDNSTWSREIPPKYRAATTSAIKKLATYISQHIDEEGI